MKKEERWENRRKEIEKITDLIAIFIAVQNTPACPGHWGITNDRKAWILVSSLSSSSSLELISGMLKALRT
jgi:hypothetical protein